MSGKTPFRIDGDDYYLEAGWTADGFLEISIWDAPTWAMQSFVLNDGELTDFLKFIQAGPKS